VTQTRSLSTIAREIRADYADKGKPVYFAAKPYVDAMATMGSVQDTYGADTGQYIVLYALSNLSTWRGDNARRIKAELRAMVN